MTGPASLGLEDFASLLELGGKDRARDRSTPGRGRGRRALVGQEQDAHEHGGRRERCHGAPERAPRRPSVQEREQEQREACRVLGVKEVVFLGHPDGFLEADVELRGEIVRLLRQYRPDVVLTWDGFRPGFNHADHRAIGIAVRDAIYPAVRDHLYYPEHAEEGLEAHQVNELLLAGSDEPDYHVDVAAHMETKLEAILCHSSQLGGRSREELRRLWEERMRSSRNGRLTESFKRVTIRRSMRQVQPPGAAAYRRPAS